MDLHYVRNLNVFVCECGQCNREFVNTKEYNSLMRRLFGEFFQLTFNYEEIRAAYSIVLKTHVHRIPRQIEVVDQTHSLFLIRL